MDIFINKFYEPSEDEVELEQLKEDLLKSKEKKEKLMKLTTINIKKIKFKPIDDES